MLICVRGQEKQVCGSEGTVVGRAGTLLFLCVGLFFFCLFNQSLIVCCVVFSACVQRFRHYRRPVCDSRAGGSAVLLAVLFTLIVCLEYKIAQYHYEVSLLFQNGNSIPNIQILKLL